MGNPNAPLGMAFVGLALFTFFNVNAFFARGQADLRALFEAIPLLMLLLLVRVLAGRGLAAGHRADQQDRKIPV